MFEVFLSLFPRIIGWSIGGFLISALWQLARPKPKRLKLWRIDWRTDLWRVTITLAIFSVGTAVTVFVPLSQNLMYEAIYFTFNGFAFAMGLIAGGIAMYPFRFSPPEARNKQLAEITFLMLVASNPVWISWISTVAFETGLHNFLPKPILEILAIPVSILLVHFLVFAVAFSLVLGVLGPAMLIFLGVNWFSRVKAHSTWMFPAEIKLTQEQMEEVLRTTPNRTLTRNWWWFW